MSTQNIKALRKVSTGELFAYSDAVSELPGFEVYHGPPPARGPRQVIVEGEFTRLESEAPPPPAKGFLGGTLESEPPAERLVEQYTPEQLATISRARDVVLRAEATEDELKVAWTDLYTVSPTVVQAMAAKIGTPADQIIDRFVQGAK